jgi:hypothetical protein
MHRTHTSSPRDLGLAGCLLVAGIAVGLVACSDATLEGEAAAGSALSGGDTATAEIDGPPAVPPAGPGLPQCTRVDVGPPPGFVSPTPTMAFVEADMAAWVGARCDVKSKPTPRDVTCYFTAEPKDVTPGEISFGEGTKGNVSCVVSCTGTLDTTLAGGRFVKAEYAKGDPKDYLPVKGEVPEGKAFCAAFQAEVGARQADCAINQPIQQGWASIGQVASQGDRDANQKACEALAKTEDLGQLCVGAAERFSGFKTTVKAQICTPK